MTVKLITQSIQNGGTYNNMCYHNPHTEWLCLVLILIMFACESVTGVTMTPWFSPSAVPLVHLTLLPTLAICYNRQD